MNLIGSYFCRMVIPGIDNLLNSFLVNSSNTTTDIIILSPVTFAPTVGNVEIRTSGSLNISHEGILYLGPGVSLKWKYN